MCGICLSQEILNLCPKSCASAADGAAASVMAVQTHGGKTFSIATSTCDDALLWYCLVVFFPLRSLHTSSKPSFLLSSALGVNPVSNMSDRWWHLSTCQCLSPSCPFCRYPWSQDEVSLMQSPIQKELWNPPIWYMVYMSKSVELVKTMVLVTRWTNLSCLLQVLLL